MRELRSATDIMIVLLEICLNLPNTSELLYSNQIIITVLNRQLSANLQPLTRPKTWDVPFTVQLQRAIHF